MMPRLGMRRLRENADFEVNDLGKVHSGWNQRPRWFISKADWRNVMNVDGRLLLVDMRGRRVRVHINYLNPLTEEAAALLAAYRLSRSAEG